MDFPPPTIRRIDPARPDHELLREAAELLSRGQLVVVPTETVYGVAADPRVPGAVDCIYRAKQRPRDKPISLLARDLEQVSGLGVVLSATARRLAERYWPGPLTLVLDAGAAVVGVRVPDYGVTLALLRACTSALAVTSANRSGGAPATTARAAVDELGANVRLALDAGPSPGGVPSTVVRVTGERCELLREGAIPESVVRRVAGGEGEA